jgi:hypothetical protein
VHGFSFLPPIFGQEIRDAILRFRAAGKRAICYAETFGELQPGSYSHVSRRPFRHLLAHTHHAALTIPVHVHCTHDASAGADLFEALSLLYLASAFDRMYLSSLMIL